MFRKGRVFKRGNSWYIDFNNGTRRIMKSFGKNKRLAEIALGKILAEIAEGKYLDVKKNEKIKFKDFANLYLELHAKPNKRSWHSDADTIKLLNKYFGGRYLYEITTLMIDKFKAERVKQVKPSTVNRNLALLKCMFNKAIQWGKFNVNNPTKPVKLFKENNQRLRFLEKEEIDRLLENSAEHLRPMVILAINTGLRKGEILNLKWHDIDIKRGIIYVLNSKNNERREVVMNEWVKKTLIAVPKHPDSPYIFCNKDGKPFGDIKKSFFTACKKSGIINFHFHDLRHTFASQMRMAGIGLDRISEYLGHKTLTMTKRYAHLSPDYRKRDFELLNQKIQPKIETKLKQLPEIEKFGQDLIISNHLVINKL